MFRLVQPFGIGSKGNGGTSGPTTLISDTFTDANGTALASHTIAPTNTPATSWSAAIGTFTIQSNHAQIATVTSNEAVALCNPGVTDGTYTMTITLGSASNGLGIIFRYTDNDNYWLLQIDPPGVQLYEKVASVFTLRDSEAPGFTVDTLYTLQVITSGTSITGTVDGANTVTFTSSANQAATQAGFRFGGSVTGTNYVDGFTVVG